MKNILPTLVKAIGKLWNFFTSVFFITLIFAMVVFVLLVFMPDAVLGAVNIISIWLTGVGIVGSG